MPAAHCVVALQEVWPASSWYSVGFAQSLHWVRPVVSAYLPASHGKHGKLLSRMPEKRPAAHGVHDAWAGCIWYWPAAHWSQLDCAAWPWYLPWGQSVHPETAAVCAPAEYVPAAHSVPLQSVWPVWSWCLPPGQSVQATDSTDDAAAEFRYLPAAHSVHEVCATWFWY